MKKVLISVFALIFVGLGGYYFYDQNKKREEQTQELLQQLQESQNRISELENTTNTTTEIETPAPTVVEIAEEATDQVKQTVYDALTELDPGELAEKAINASEICSSEGMYIRIVPVNNKFKGLVEINKNGPSEYFNMLDGYKYSVNGNNELIIKNAEKSISFPCRDRFCAEKMIKYLVAAEKITRSSL